MNEYSRTVSEIGEKRLIAEFIRPLFNQANEIGGVGDDCAMLNLNDGTLLLASTDRVPANLISFKLGLLDYRGLGRYLACLNLSDIAACGGKAEALLLNMGVPAALLYRDFAALCNGFEELASSFGIPILGGDITDSCELSISATALGRVAKEKVLTRRGATPGDSIFVSKPVGLTPAAFAFYSSDVLHGLEASEADELKEQFTHTSPMLALASRLRDEGICSSCIDNTDGIGQSLTELSQQSGAQMTIDFDSILLPNVVEKIGAMRGENAYLLALSAGADFSLVGTLHGEWTNESASLAVGAPLQVVGQVQPGSGVFFKQGGDLQPLEVRGWNYFVDCSAK